MDENLVLVWIVGGAAALGIYFVLKRLLLAYLAHGGTVSSTESVTGGIVDYGPTRAPGLNEVANLGSASGDGCGSANNCGGDGSGTT